MVTHDNYTQGHSGDGLCTVGNVGGSEPADHHGPQRANFYIPRCSACNYEMKFAEGDVIYGDKWYHSMCWHEIQDMVEMVSQ